MHFASIATAVLMALTTTVIASPIENFALTAGELVTDLNELVTQTTAFSRVVSDVGQSWHPYEPVINGYHDLCKTASNVALGLWGTEPFADADARRVCAAYHDFVAVHQTTLTFTIEKSGLGDSELQHTVAVAIGDWESCIDNLSYGIIDSVPSCAASATTDKQKLDSTLSHALAAYEGSELDVSAEL